MRKDVISVILAAVLIVPAIFSGCETVGPGKTDTEERAGIYGYTRFQGA